MTFSQLIINSRYHLFDVREKTGQIIDDASKDGIRWSSALLQLICKDGLNAMLRSFRALDLKQNVNEASYYRMIPELKINKGTGVLSGANIESIKISHLLRLQTPTLEKIYSGVNPEQFFAERYRTSDLEDGTKPLEDGTFTILYDLDSKKRIIYTNPIYNVDINSVQAIVRVPYNELFTLASEVDLPIIDVDDLLYDFIEREARRKESNSTMVKELDQIINNKLTELKIGLSRSPQ